MDIYTHGGLRVQLIIQEKSTWDLGNSNCSTGSGEVHSH